MKRNDITRRKFLKQSAVTLALSNVSAWPHQSTKPISEVKMKKKSQPNIMLITTDYQRGLDGPSLGSPFLKMPAFDRLCREGAVFTNHVSTCPICMPTRATWVTGQYPHTHGLWDNLRYSFSKNGPFLPRELQELGYRTLGIGKMHFYPWEADYNYDIRIVDEGKDLKNFMEDDYNKYLQKHGLDRDTIHGFKGTYKMSGGQTVYDWPVDEKLHHDYFVGLETLNSITRGELDTNDPWFMWVSFPGPHNPWNSPKRFAEPYRQMDDLPLGNFVEDELMEKPMWCTRHRYCYGHGMWDVYDYLNDEQKVDLRRRLRAAHYGNLSLIDEQIGKIMAELEQRKLLDNTVVVFTSDHGSALFDNQMLHKGTHFPTQMFVPFVVWWPGKINPGERQNFSAHSDLYSTLMEIAGGKPHSGNEGNSLIPMLMDAGEQIKEFDIVETTLVTSIITKKWTCGFHHFNEEVDLYDRDSDPMCHYNLADKPESKDIIDDLRNKLVQWRRDLAPNDSTIPDNPFEWRECLGPQKTINQFRQNYIKQYKQLAEFDEKERPGKVGKRFIDPLLKKLT